MPRPSQDILELLISDFKGYVKDKDNNDVEVRAGWITAQSKFPVVTINKIGEWCRVLDVRGSVEAFYADYAIDAFATDYNDMNAMVETINARIKQIKKAHQDIGIVFLTEVEKRRIVESEIVPLLYHEHIKLRLWWFEE